MMQKLQDEGTFHETSPIYNSFDIMHLKRTCKYKSSHLVQQLCWTLRENVFLLWRFCGLSIVRDEEQ